MSFAENLKAVRKEKNISQEELAELLAVSRQAVSKWEQGSGYPEVEKMLLLSQTLNVSLDYLMCGERQSAAPQQPKGPASGKIMISSLETKAIVNCYKVVSSPVFKTKAGEPKYALYGVDGSSYWGENNTLLGWYASEEALNKELNAIMTALKNGEPSYTLQYAARVRHSFFSVKLEE